MVRQAPIGGKSGNVDHRYGNDCGVGHYPCVAGKAMTDNVVSFPEHGRRPKIHIANFCSQCGAPLKLIATEQPTKSLGWKIVEVAWSLVVVAIVWAVFF